MHGTIACLGRAIGGLFFRSTIADSSISNVRRVKKWPQHSVALLPCLDDLICVCDVRPARTAGYSLGDNSVDEK